MTTGVWPALPQPMSSVGAIKARWGPLGPVGACWGLLGPVGALVLEGSPLEGAIGLYSGGFPMARRELWRPTKARWQETLLEHAVCLAA